MADSSHIQDFTHDGRDLKVTFHNGQTYLYRNVSRETFDGMKQARSTGTFFHRFVRKYHQGVLQDATREGKK